jgi:hypothetical protein
VKENLLDFKKGMHAWVSLIKMIALRQNYEKGKLLQLIEDSIFDDTQRTKFEKEVTKFYGFEFGSL